MATITISLPEEFNEIRKKFPETNWNEVLKIAIMKRLIKIEKIKELNEKEEL